MSFMGIFKIDNDDERRLDFYRDLRKYEAMKQLDELCSQAVLKKKERLEKELQMETEEIMGSIELKVEDFSFSFDCFAKNAEQAADIARRLEIEVEGIEFWGNGRATVMVYGASMSDIRDLNKLLRVNGIEVL